MQSFHCVSALLVSVVIAIAIGFDTATSTGSDGQKSQAVVYHRSLQPLDPAGKYHLEYEIDLGTKRATFLIEVETRGYIGFGFSYTGGMANSDIVIGGVYENGTFYFVDRHGVGNSVPILDDHDDYDLMFASNNETHTALRFSRKLDTCDDQDVAITADTIKLIWAYGADDTNELIYHGTNRGTTAANLLDPPMEAPKVNEEGLEKWTLVANTSMPAKATTYWCSIHKTPASYDRKRHMVALDTWLPTPEALRHTHHLTLQRCRAPPGQDPDALFGPLVALEGGECRVPVHEQVIPIGLCQEIVYVWAVGGKRMVFPGDVGYPMNEDGKPEYFMIEIHYDNPNLLEGIRFESMIEVYNTPILRKYDAGMVLVGHAVTYSHTVPPQTASYMTVGHCSSQCTRATLPEEGIYVFNVLLHAHTAGRKLKLRHFRNSTELPWIANDDHYNFDYQQSRPLREPVQVLPGDHLTTECVQSTKDRPNVTLAGLGTTEEMCQSFIWYYPACELRYCESAYDEKKIGAEFGIEEIEWSNTLVPPIVRAPKSLAGKTYNEVLNTLVDWNPKFVAELESKTRFTGHKQASCGVEGDVTRTVKFDKDGTKLEEGHVEVGYDVNYPEVDYEFKPDNSCV